MRGIRETRARIVSYPSFLPFSLPFSAWRLVKYPTQRPRPDSDLAEARIKRGGGERAQ